MTVTVIVSGTLKKLNVLSEETCAELAATTEQREQARQMMIAKNKAKEN